jgi:hypothetical protein
MGCTGGLCIPESLYHGRAEEEEDDEEDEDGEDDDELKSAGAVGGRAGFSICCMRST